MKRILHTAIIISVAFVMKAQQQSLFTNINLNPYLYNPAYAGANAGQQYNADYRNQWTGFDGAPVTISGSGYGTFKKRPQMAVGGIIINDKSGLIQRTSFYASYSYHIKLGKKLKMGFGLAAGGAQYNVKIYNAKPYPTDKDDPFLSNNILNANSFDANAGIYLYSKKFFLGFSSLQMINGKIYWQNSIGKLTPHFYLYTGYNFTLDGKKKEWTLQPSLLARFNAPAPYQFEGNLRIIYKDMIWIGGAYRMRGPSTSDHTNLPASGCAMLGTTISKQFTFAYSYDYALSALQQYSSGTHEAMLGYTLAAKKRKTASEKVSDADEDEFNNIDNSMKTNIKNKKKDEEKK
jgi:type IX secretion system PorP/SprF family membrane protein